MSSSQQIRIRSRESKSEKDQNRESKSSQKSSQKQKEVKNRESIYKANPKPTVKVRKRVKTRKSLTEEIQTETRQKHEKHQPQQSPNLPTENSRKECSYYVPAALLTS